MLDIHTVETILLCFLLYSLCNFISPSLFNRLCFIDITELSSRLLLVVWHLTQSMMLKNGHNTLYKALYQGRMGLGDYFMGPVFGSPFGHPLRVSVSQQWGSIDSCSAVVQDNPQILSTQLISSQSLPIFCLHSWLFLSMSDTFTVWLHCLVFHLFQTIVMVREISYNLSSFLQSGPVTVEYNLRM